MNTPVASIPVAGTALPEVDIQVDMPLGLQQSATIIPHKVPQDATVSAVSGLIASIVDNVITINDTVYTVPSSYELLVKVGDSVANGTLLGLKKRHGLTTKNYSPIHVSE